MRAYDALSKNQVALAYENELINFNFVRRRSFFGANDTPYIILYPIKIPNKIINRMATH